MVYSLGDEHIPAGSQATDLSLVELACLLYQLPTLGYARKLYNAFVALCGGESIVTEITCNAIGDLDWERTVVLLLQSMIVPGYRVLSSVDQTKLAWLCEPGSVLDSPGQANASEQTMNTYFANFAGPDSANGVTRPYDIIRLAGTDQWTPVRAIDKTDAENMVPPSNPMGNLLYEKPASTGSTGGTAPTWLDNISANTVAIYNLPLFTSTMTPQQIVSALFSKKPLSYWPELATGSASFDKATDYKFQQIYTMRQVLQAAIGIDLTI
jgi:hypothetical protein